MSYFYIDIADLIIVGSLPYNVKQIEATAAMIN